MANELTGGPDAAVIVYGLQRGAYDDHLWELEQAIRSRRKARASVGSIILSRGDRVELMDKLKKTPALASAIVRVVRIPEDRKKIVVKIEKTMLPTYHLGRIYKIPRDWVLCPVSEE